MRWRKRASRTRGSLLQRLGLENGTSVLGEQLVRCGAGCAVAVLGTLLLDLERVSEHACGNFLAHDVLCGTTCEGDELVDRGVVLVDGVKELLGRVVGVGTSGDGVLPALGSLARSSGALGGGQQLVDLLCGVVKQFLVHAHSFWFGDA